MKNWFQSLLSHSACTDRYIEAQAVDGAALLEMSTRDLEEELGVTSFPARKSIGAAIERLRRLQQ